MDRQEVRKELKEMSKEDLVELCLQLLIEQMEAAARLCTKLAELGGKK
jgi:ribosomal protein L29